MNKIFSFGKKKEQSPSRPSNKPPSSFGIQTPNSTEGYLIRSKDLGKIHKAALRGDVAKVQQLLMLGKNSVNDLDKMKRTPLHLACANGHPDVVCLLVERKCQLNLLDKDSRTPLMKAIECQQEECATILLEHGADPNLGDARNNNALHYIASGRTKFMAEKLVKHKIDIEAKNKEGLTPLLLAVSTMNFEMAGFLLKNGANVNALDSCKRTALMIAISVESIGLVTLLLQNNADYTLQDIAGWTAQTYAERYGYPVHIYHKQIEKQMERNNSCPPQISCSEETSGIVPSLDKKAEESSSEDSISRLSDKTGPDDTLPSTDDEMDFDTECSHKSLLETSARRLFVSRNQNIKEKISLRKSEDFIEEFDLTDADDIDDLKQKSKFKGSSERNKETFDKRDQEQHSRENHLEISTRRVLVPTNQNIKDSISLGQHEGHLRRNSNGKPIQPVLQMKDSFISQKVGKGVKEKLEFDALKWDSTSTSLIKESHKSSNDMKLQSDFLGKSLTVNQHQLASTKFERIPSKEGEAVAGIGPVTDYKVGIQLEKPVPKKKCSKEIKLQSNYPGNSLPPSQNQLPSTIFEKIPSIIGEAVVGIGPAIDYKVGVQLEKPVPQKQCEPPLQKEKQKEVKKDLKQELKFRGPSELPEASSALAKNLNDSVEKEKDKGPLSVDLQSFPGQREDSSENVCLKNLKISFSKNVLQFSSYMCSKKSTPQSKNKPKIERTYKVNEENIAYVAKNIKRADSKFSINKIKEDRLFGIEMTFSQHKNITNLESDSGLLQSSGPGSHFGVQLTHSGNMTSINQGKNPELIIARKCKEKTKHIETSFQNSHHNATNSTNEGRYSLSHGDKISKICLDKELKQDKQRLINELGMLQAEFLTLKKEKIQPQKEVEEKKQKHQQNKINTLERKDDDELTENRRMGNANEQFSVESHQHGKDEENKIPGEEIPIMSISSKEYLAPVQHVLKGSWREETMVKHQRNYYSFGKFEEKEIKIGENVKMSEDEKWIPKDSSTTREKVNSSSCILLHRHDDSETDSDELRLTKITLHEKNKDEVEMAADALDNLTQSHDRATRAYDLSPSNYIKGSPCLQEDQNAVLLSDLSVKFKNLQLTQLTRKVMSLENTIRELQENFSERIKTEFQLMHQKGECDTCRSRLESEKQNKEKLQAEIGYPSCVSSAILDMEHETSKLNLLEERDEWLVLKDQLIYKIGSLSIKLSKAENEINQLRDSLREKTMILENTHRELNQAKDKVKEFEHKNHMEKEKSDRSFLTKVSMQEGLTQMQRGIQLLPEPFEDVQNKEVFKIMVSHGVQMQLNDRSMTLYAENEKQDCMVEERNQESDDEYIHLRKQIHKYENEKPEGEHVIRKLQELVHFKKEESVTSQEIMSPYQKVLDVKSIWKELDQSKSKLQESQEENEQLQWCINELEDYVQKIKMENSILEDSVKEQMCKDENFQKNILDTTLTQGAEKDNLGKQLENRLEELKAELSQMKISNEKCMAELETYRGRSQDSEEYAGLYLTSSWFGVTEPTNIWSLTDLYQKIFWNNF